MIFRFRWIAETEVTPISFSVYKELKASLISFIQFTMRREQMRVLPSYLLKEEPVNQHVVWKSNSRPQYMSNHTFILLCSEEHLPHKCF